VEGEDIACARKRMNNHKDSRKFVEGHCIYISNSVTLFLHLLHNFVVFRQIYSLVMFSLLFFSFLSSLLNIIYGIYITQL
jgi:hypothetical protein